MECWGGGGEIRFINIMFAEWFILRETGKGKADIKYGTRIVEAKVNCV